MNFSPKGFVNPSVCCYKNSALQCLLSIPELNYYFANELYKTEKLSEKSKACEAMNELVNSYSRCSRSAIISKNEFLNRTQSDSYV